MRKGFKSSRGAMRGTMGGARICLVGAVGFATVAIGVGPFVYSICLRNFLFIWPKFKVTASKFWLSIRRKLLRINGIRVAAGSGAKVMKLTSVPERNGTRFVHMHPTYRIAHQSARRGWNSGRTMGSLRARGRLIPAHAADAASQHPQSPGEDQQPKQKSHDASKKVHLNDCELNGRLWLITLNWAAKAVYARR